MRILRPIAQSITSVSVVALGCMGAQVTTDFMLIAGLAGAAGLVSLAFAIFDERRAEKDRLSAEKESLEQGRQIDALVKSIGEITGNRDVPLQLRDLTVVSSSELKRLAAEEVARLRGFEAQRTNALFREGHTPGFSLFGPAEKAIAWDQENRRIRETMAAFFSDFSQNYRPSGKALWEELKRRAPQAAPPAFPIVAFETQTIAGPTAAGEAADDIERLARMIPDD